jgi:hypothetical protein
VLAGVAVSEIRPVERTLEDVFSRSPERTVATMGGSCRANAEAGAVAAMWVLRPFSWYHWCSGI